MQFLERRRSLFPGLRSRRRGASIVEFALVVPLLITLLLGILEFALLSRNNLMLANAAREGARTLALGRTTTAAKTRIKSVATSLNIQDSAISFLYSSNDGVTYANSVGDSGTNNNAPIGSLIKVSLNYPHQSLTKFFPFLNNYILKANAAMRREG